MWIKRDVVMLLTEKASSIALCIKSLGEQHFNTKKGELVGGFIKEVNPEYFQKQHLYILSDEEIKEGDYCIEFIKGIPTNVLQIKGHDFKRCLHNYKKLKKIIATTDKSLTICDGCKLKLPLENKTHPSGKILRINHIELPQPSQSFIQKFIEEHNKSNNITEVTVEYEQYDFDEEWSEASGAYETYKERLKINPKDNTISIRKIKDSWNRDEHITNLLKYRKDYEQFRKDCYLGPNEKEIAEWSEKWIEQNL